MPIKYTHGKDSMQGYLHDVVEVTDNVFKHLLLFVIG